MAGNTQDSLRIWDPFVRVAHWTLVAAFIVAYVTHEDAGTVHAWSGYVVGVIVLLRIAWGFVGSRHARFKDFSYSPGQALAYLVDLLRGRARRYLGHSPAGGVMVFALLAALFGTVGTGLVVEALENNAGPLAGLVTAEAAPPALLSVAYADDDHADDDDDHDGEEQESAALEFWEEIHEFLANLTVFLVLLHIGGVTLASFAHRENLPLAMVTGRKPRQTSSAHPRAPDATRS